MLTPYTARYTKIDSGYLGQLVEWPEVVTEGSDVEECRSMLRDALNEMILAYRQQGKEIPPREQPPRIRGRRCGPCPSKRDELIPKAAHEQPKV